MKINKAAKVTGLTKKAIRYYEEKGLISISSYDEAGYKNYDEKAIETLHQIAFLRSIDMPINDIADFLKSENKKSLLAKQINSINSKIAHLESVKAAINSAIENQTDYSKLYLDINNSTKLQSDYILNKIKTLFPTYFGEYIIIHFAEYLNEPVDTVQKEDALNNIIEFIDNLDESPIEDTLSKYFNDISTSQMNQIHFQVDEKLKNLNVNIDDEIELNKFKDEIQKTTEQMEKAYAAHPEIKKAKEKLTAFLNECGYYDIFIKNLRILSSKYDEYVKYYERLNKAIYN